MDHTEQIGVTKEFTNISSRTSCINYAVLATLLLLSYPSLQAVPYMVNNLCVNSCPDILNLRCFNKHDGDSGIRNPLIGNRSKLTLSSALSDKFLNAKSESDPRPNF